MRSLTIFGSAAVRADILCPARNAVNLTYVFQFLIILVNIIIIIITIIIVIIVSEVTRSRFQAQPLLKIHSLTVVNVNITN